MRDGILCRGSEAAVIDLEVCEGMPRRSSAMGSTGVLARRFWRLAEITFSRSERNDGGESGWLLPSPEIIAFVRPCAAARQPSKTGPPPAILPLAPRGADTGETPESTGETPVLPIASATRNLSNEESANGPHGSDLCASASLRFNALTAAQSSLSAPTHKWPPPARPPVAPPHRG